MAAVSTGTKVLIEKPLAATASEAKALASAGGDHLAVAYNLRFHDPVVRCHAALRDIGPVFGGRLWFGSYLPDWRPVDYRETYSARSDLGGGVLLDAIHELDLALWFFGDDLRVEGAIVTRAGGLDIDVEDTVKALLTTANGAAVDVSLDYLSRRYRRGIEVVGADATVRLDWARNVVEREDRASVTTSDASVPLDRSYELEAAAFLAWIDGGAEMPVGGAMGWRSVALGDAIRAAAR
jgi:predicted dehydrogenase